MAPWTQKTLGQALMEIARTYPNKTALIFKDQQISYRMLLEKARELAKGFLALGIGKNDKISIWSGNCLEWVYTQLATALIGAVLVPVNPRFRTSELEYILSQSDSTTLILMNSFLNMDFAAMLREVCPEMDNALPGRLQSARLPMLRNIIFLTRHSRNQTG